MTEETMVVYKERDLLHLPGPNPGTPYTACGLDAGMFSRREHPVTNAALWCSECMRTLARPE
jgi:hypothetical protein